MVAAALGNLAEAGIKKNADNLVKALTKVGAEGGANSGAFAKLAGSSADESVENAAILAKQRDSVASAIYTTIGDVQDDVLEKALKKVGTIDDITDQSSFTKFITDFSKQVEEIEVAKFVYDFKNVDNPDIFALVTKC